MCASLIEFAQFNWSRISPFDVVYRTFTFTSAMRRVEITIIFGRKYQWSHKTVRTEPFNTFAWRASGFILDFVEHHWRPHQRNPQCQSPPLKWFGHLRTESINLTFAHIIVAFGRSKTKSGRSLGPRGFALLFILFDFLDSIKHTHASNTKQFIRMTFWIYTFQ